VSQAGGEAVAGGWTWRLRRWSPDYDAARAEPTGGPAPRVDPGVERAPRAWAAVAPLQPAAARIAFVDGVQRVDAWADLDGPDGDGAEALLASYAAGAVLVERGRAAQLVGTRVERGVFGGPVEAQPDLVVGTERYRHHPSRRPGAPLEVGLQVARDGLEVTVAEEQAGAADGRLVVVDGPLHHRDHLPGAVGYVKSHRVEYLDEPVLRRVVTGLAPGQRSPLFLIDSGWARWSWYLRLPTGAPVEAGWTGLVRGEAAHRLAPSEAASLADVASASLVRFASSPWKDARAPQNLVPVGGMERLLRHRLGDRELLDRALRRALWERPAAARVNP
jgi:hypothetical protein